MTTPLKKIVIVGGGAGGLEMATQLGHKLGRKKKAKITLVDRNHSHLWKPLLHEVATGSLDEGVDALSYLAHARNHGFQFQLGSVIDIDREAKTITIAELRDEKGELLVPERKIAYDTLVMALGSTSNDFNTPGVKENCIFLDNPSTYTGGCGINALSALEEQRDRQPRRIRHSFRLLRILKYFQPFPRFSSSV